MKPTADFQSLANQMLLQRFSPPAVLVNDRGEILYLSGRTGKYLEPATGKANWNIYAMVRDGLRLDLETAFQKAVREKGKFTVKGLKVENSDATQLVDITAEKIQEPEALRGMVMIVFTDVPPPKKAVRIRSKSGGAGNTRIAELEEELQKYREELETTRKEMRSSQEELNFINEELQSTKENLTASREEMQSLNEELQAVNAEQISKMDELSKINDDMWNLLNRPEIMTVFLDNKLRIRRFTPGTNTIFKLISGDVGRPLFDISSTLLCPELSEYAREVLRTSTFFEKQIPATDGHWFSVRIMPYRTMGDVIGGLVITFANITTAKDLEKTLHAEIARLKLELEGGDLP